MGTHPQAGCDHPLASSRGRSATRSRNKLRRSPSLREVPLILISSEETLATFEQHRKLKSRADEYLLKPIDGSDLLAKVGGLLKLDLGGSR